MNDKNIITKFKFSIIRISFFPDEINFLVNVILATAATFHQFFESAEKAPSKKHVETGKRYVARLIVHYTQGQMRTDFEKFIQGKE